MKVLSTQKNSRQCIVCGMENPLSLKASFYNLDNDSVGSVFTFKAHHQSYPDRTHGGMVATLLDELMGRALWINEPDKFAITTSMSVTYRKPVPYEEKLKARAYITFNSNRGYSAIGQIYSFDNTLLAEASAKYMKIPLSVAFNGEAGFHKEMCYKMPLDLSEIDFPPIIK